MFTFVYVALGGAIGSVARFALAGLIDRGIDDPFPAGTVIVNITGCFIIGFFAMLTGPNGRFQAPPELRAFFTIGVCGGYTTFSSFSLQTLTLAQNGDMKRATLNVLVSVVFCLVGVYLGTMAAAAVNQLKGA
jgi:CrcB protein